MLKKYLTPVTVRTILVNARNTRTQRQFLRTNQARQGIRSGLRSSALGILPDVVEVVDGYTGGALESGFKAGVEGLKDLFIKGVQGWQQILTPQPAAPQQPVNYGQSNSEPLVKPTQQQPKAQSVQIQQQREPIFGERRDDGKQWGGQNLGGKALSHSEPFLYR